MTTDPTAVPDVVPRAEHDAALAQQVVAEKELTHLGDSVSARRRRLPMTPIDDYVFEGEDGPVRLADLFAGRSQLVLQSFMFHPDWEDGCPSCTWAADNLPHELDELLAPKDVAFAMVSRAPLASLQRWREIQGWDHLRWASSSGTTFNADWGWTVDARTVRGTPIC
jgi:predicted dithiol-disulfide oxidoreductase (DUF899 family)